MSHVLCQCCRWLVALSADVKDGTGGWVGEEALPDAAHGQPLGDDVWYWSVAFELGDFDWWVL